VNIKLFHDSLTVIKESRKRLIWIGITPKNKIPAAIGWLTCLALINSAKQFQPYNNNQTLSTKRGQLHESNDAIVFYQKPCLSPTHLSLDPSQ